ncbi:MAG: prepilin peptidase [Defluviitaleaceae bacterium]|nr:prepilin peptidase [Defluviitaleaceae bacterium]
MSIVKPRSGCPSCGKTLTAPDLIPVFSWLFLRGKCRFCKERISPRYVLVELLCGGLFAAMVFYSPTLSAIPLVLLVFVLVVVSMIDIDTQEIYDVLLIFGVAVGVAWVVAGHFFPAAFPYSPGWVDALIGLVAGALPLFLLDKLTLLILKKDGFGYGDVKLMAMVGIFLGWQLTFMAFFFAFLGGGVFAVVLLARKKVKRGEYLAFGPFLCAGTLLSLWFGEAVLSAYLGLF